MRPDRAAELAFDGPVNVRWSAMRHALQGPSAALRPEGEAVLRAVHTEAGPSAVRYAPLAADRVRVEAWGPGADELIAEAAAVLGAEDAPEDFAPDHPRLRELARRHPGLRFGGTGRVWPRLLQAVVGQLVTGKGGARSYRDLLHNYGEPAPLGLICPPLPERLARLAPFHLVPCGLEAKRARTLIRCAQHRLKLRKVEAMPAEEAFAWLQRLPGIGPWTAALVVASSHGWADAVPVGDYNLPHLVSYALRGERRGDDAGMLALLEPFRPHRGRALALLALGGPHPPRRGPRSDVRDIRGR